MSKGHGVSGKTHTKQQLNDYANQNNPNNKAYQARKANERQYAKKRKHIVWTLWLIWNGIVMAGLMISCKSFYDE